MENEQAFTIEEQIEFIKHEIEVKEEYAGLVEDEPLESETIAKEISLLHAVRLSLVRLDLLHKIEAESVEPIATGDNR